MMDLNFVCFRTTLLSHMIKVQNIVFISLLSNISYGWFTHVLKHIVKTWKVGSKNHIFSEDFEKCKEMGLI